MGRGTRRRVLLVVGGLCLLLRPSLARAERGALTLQLESGLGAGWIPLEEGAVSSTHPALLSAREGVSLRYALRHTQELGVEFQVGSASHRTLPKVDFGNDHGVFEEQVSFMSLSGLWRLLPFGLLWRPLLAVGGGVLTHRHTKQQLLWEQGSERYAFDRDFQSKLQLEPALLVQLGLERSGDHLNLGLLLRGELLPFVAASSSWSGTLSLEFYAAWSLYP